MHDQHSASSSVAPPPISGASSSSSPLSRLSSWMSGCFSRTQAQMQLSSKSSPSLFERVKAAATTSRFEREMLKQADALIETFFNDKHFKADKAQQFDKACQENLSKCLENFRDRTDLKKTEKSAASVLKVVHKLVVDFHMRRIRHPKRLTLLCWEWDSQHERYKTGGDMSRWEIEVCRGVGHVKQYCSQKFKFNPQNIHIIYQGRHLTDDERFRDVCVQQGSFINMIFLRDEDTLKNVNLDVAEMEHGTPQECIERSEKWMKILRQLVDSDVVGPKVSKLTWEVMRALPRRSCYQHVLMELSDKRMIFDGDVVLPKELAGLIGQFVPSTIQDIYLERTNGDPAGVDTSLADAASAAENDTSSAARDSADSDSVADVPASEATTENEAGEAVDQTQTPAVHAPASPPTDAHEQNQLESQSSFSSS